MYKVILNDNIDELIDNFIDSYLSVAMNMFIDCGIDDIALIEKNYYDRALNLRDNIYEKVSSVLLSDIVGTHTSDLGKNYTIVTVGNFRLFVYYTEEENTRYIEDIEFFRK